MNAYFACDIAESIVDTLLVLLKNNKFNLMNRHV